MTRWRAIAFSGVLLGIGAQALVLAGCGGGASQGGAGSEVKNAPAVNPAPGSVPLEDESKQSQPAGKEKAK